MRFHIGPLLFMLLFASVVSSQVKSQTMRPSTFSSETDSHLSNGSPPPLINVGGMLRDDTGKPLSGIVGVTFALYRNEEGGNPLWLETQNLHVNENGLYSATLGSEHSEGIPLELFGTGEPRWLGITVLSQAVGEMPRSQLFSVPYALKAADADTLGGKPLSAFVLATEPGSTSEKHSLSETSADSKRSANASSASTGTAIVSNPSATQTINAPSKPGVIPLQIKGNTSDNSFEIYDSQNRPVLQSYFNPEGRFVSHKSPALLTMFPGSVLFSATDGVLSQDNSNFYWDMTASALKLGPRTSTHWGSAFDFPIYRFAHRKTVSSPYTTGFGSLYESTVSGESIAAGYFLATDEHDSGVVPYTQTLVADAYKTAGGNTRNLWAGSFYANAGSSGTVGGMASIVAVTNTNTGASVDDNYGLLVLDQAGVGMKNWAIKTGTGKVYFGDSIEGARSFTAGQVLIASSSTPTIDASNGNSFKMVLTTNVTGATFINGTVGQRITVILCQDEIGGRTMVWPSNVRLSDQTFSLTTTANKCDTLTGIYDGSTWYETSRALNL